jgi:hypothetical protein
MENSNSLSIQLLLGLGVGSILMAYVINRSLPTRQRQHGPKGWPILGNLLEMPEARPWATFKRWGAEYGNFLLKWYRELPHPFEGSPFFLLSILGRKILVLNSRRSLDDLLNEKNYIYSGRPPLVVMSKW